MTHLRGRIPPGPQLELVGSLPLPGAGRLAVHGDHVFVGVRNDGAHALRVVDVSRPEAPTQVATRACKGFVSGVAVRDDTLFVAESGRGVSFFDVRDPGAPAYLDCVVTLGLDIGEMVLGDRFMALAMEWDGVGLVDLEDLGRARLVDRLKIEEGLVSRLEMVGDHVFAAGTRAGLQVLAIEGGHLELVGRPSPEEFSAFEVSRVGDAIWATGDEGRVSRLLVIDPDQPMEIRQTLDFTHQRPDVLLGLEGGGALGFLLHYTCAAFSPEDAWSDEIFKQFLDDDGGAYVETAAGTRENVGPRESWDVRRSCMDDVRDAVCRGGYLYASQGSALNVYAFPEGSIFRSCKA